MKFLHWIALLVCCGPALAADSGNVATDRAARAELAGRERLAYAASARYNPYESESRELHKAASGWLEKDDFQKALATAKEGLTHAPYDIDLLMLVSIAQRESGEIKQADETRAQWIALVDSILAHGDGRDFATAFQVISVREEYAVLRILKLKVIRQTLRAHGGSEFDVMTVQADGSDETFEMFFNIDLPKKWLNRQFSK